MDKKQVKRNLILGILFFLPVIFLLFLYPAQHNYNALEVLKENVSDLNGLTTSDSDNAIVLNNHITVIGFLGDNPMGQVIPSLNLKELIYDKFKGFKTFQVVMVVPIGAEAQVESLRKEISAYEELKYWHFVYGNELQIRTIFNSLKTNENLENDLSSQHVFIVDKELNQRGRIDDRTDNEMEANKPIYPLTSYNCIEVAEIKNKMSEDVRILFTEYRQKRKGDFNSTSRRADDLKGVFTD